MFIENIRYATGRRTEKTHEPKQLLDSETKNGRKKEGLRRLNASKERRS